MDAAGPGTDLGSEARLQARRLTRPAIDFLGLAFGAVLGATAVSGVARAVLVWLALIWAALAVAFFRRSAALLGKSADGERPWLLVLAWLPYLGYAAGLRALKRLIGIDPVPWHEVAPGLWLGRSPFRGERVPEVEIAVDLAAEVSTPAERVAPARYVSLPALNKLVPEALQFASLARELADPGKRVFIFCGAGKGRSATFAAAVLLARGICRTPTEAELLLAGIRPGVRLHPPQHAFLERFSRSEERSSAPLRERPPRDVVRS